jgi:Spy/CpxP family protein refolding chaperone
MKRKSVLGALATVAMLTGPAAAQALAPVDPPPVHQQWGQGMEERGGPGHWAGHRGHGQFARRRGPWGRPLISVMLRHRQELGLSTGQVESLERLRTDFMRAAIQNRANQQLARLDLATLLRPDPADPAKPVDMAKVEAKIRDISRMKADLQVARLGAIEKGKAELSADQRAKLATLLTQARSHGDPAERPVAPPRQ